MNKRLLQQINKNLNDSRIKIKFENCNLQKHVLEQLELSTCKMYEYIKFQSDFLKLYIQELRDAKPDEMSLLLLDGLEETIRTIKQETAPSRGAFESTKMQFKDNHIKELEGLVFHTMELNEYIVSLDKIEKVLFSYPLTKN